VLGQKENEHAAGVLGAWLPRVQGVNQTLITDADRDGCEPIPDDRAVTDRGVRRTRADLRIIQVKYTSVVRWRAALWAALMGTSVVGVITGIRYSAPIAMLAALAGCLTAWNFDRLRTAKEFIYAPHAVACVVKEFNPLTSPDVVRITVASKLLQLATIPVPCALSVALNVGNCAAIESVFKAQDFRVAPGGLRWAPL